MKFLKTVKTVVALGISAVMLSTLAYGSDLSADDYQDEEYDCSAMVYDCETGEVTPYVPSQSVSTLSSETGGITPGYNPFPDDEEDPEEKSESIMRTTVMSDNRVVVPDTTISVRYRGTVNLNIKDENNKSYLATGFLIRSNVIVTAGHVIYNEEYGGGHWASSITATPARQTSGVIAPYGTAKLTTLICSTKWIEKGDYDYDWGVIILDSNIGDKTGWFGLSWQSSSYNGTSARANGYQDYCQYTSSGTISSSKTRTLASRNIYVVKGMSGSPCYTYTSESGYLAIGIASYYASLDSAGKYHTETVFVRITESLYNSLLGYCEEYKV